MVGEKKEDNTIKDRGEALVKESQGLIEDVRTEFIEIRNEVAILYNLVSDIESRLYGDGESNKEETQSPDGLVDQITHYKELTLADINRIKRFLKRF